MKDYLFQLVQNAPTAIRGRNIVREYLQERILNALQGAGAMIPLAFHGGTALRFLYAHSRFSEDLDFALERHVEQYDFRAYLHAIRSELSLENYTVELKVNDRKVVHSAFVRFPGLINELGLSPHRDESLSVKIEVDTNPPQGAGLATTVIRRHVVLHLQHHDRASLLAGKLHAILQRPYLKGRDLYDLVWYLSDPDWPSPNLILLNHALQQSDWQGEALVSSTWREAVRRRLQDVRWENVLSDVRPFLEPGADAKMISPELLDSLLATDRRGGDAYNHS